MGSEDNDHQQTALTEDFDSTSDAEESCPALDSDLRALVDRYLTSQRTTGSQAYASTAASVLNRWEAWMATESHELDELNDPQTGARVLNEYALQLAERVANDELVAATAERYFAIVSACLSFGVRQGALDRNPALAEAASESLPQQQRSDRTDQQFWTAVQREAIVEFVDERAAAAPDAALMECRNRALVRILAYSGVRGAEILSHTKDDREGRNGLRWENVDFDAGTMLIFGKNQTWERTPLPSKCLPAVRELHSALAPEDGQWPVFPSGHSPSLYEKARAELGDRFDRLLADEHGDIWQLFRVQNLSPPPLTTAGARSVMKRLTDEADLDVDGEYLKLHGGRRGLGDLLYRIDRGHAQDILRHDDLSTTQKAYQHIDAEERREQLDRHLEDTDE
ncbi:tyrosine-type recombinase/integrase [Haloglomus litoreum]|uniref:tyrosine-type recombinase/integrase n=1 Tax=Haloglomus litoreum TaxID=3034026 RepID=UPI0023E88A41|nr:site-specific integrase [Haloglomus sp. DT116]